MLNSSAYQRGEFVLIKSENPTFAQFIKTGTNAKDVKEAVLRVTGNRCRLGIYSRPAEPQPTQKAEKSEDPLDAFLSKAQQLGVSIQE